MFIIFNGLKDWKEHPVIMTVDTFDSQLQNIDLPAVTLCPSPGKFQPDNWAQTEQVFNQFEFNCKPGNNDCAKVREDFEPVLRMIFDSISEKFEELTFEPIALEKMWQGIEF